MTAPAPAKLSARGLSAWRGSERLLTRVDLEMQPKRLTAILGPSSCGKSTLLRCFNRLHELRPKTRIAGERLLDGEPLAELPATEVRRRIGTIFRRPRAFPRMSIRDNVLAGPRLAQLPMGERSEELVHSLLHRVGLWSQLKDRLHRSAEELARGQLQRLCIARALAVSPEVLLLDEPCWGLDPIEMAQVEDTIQDLRRSLTVVLATHNVQQAARVSDTTVILLAGRVVEVGPTERVFTSPQDTRTEDYITSRFHL